MKLFLANLSANMVSLSCVVASAYLAANERKGWGWFLVAGVICCVSYKSNGKDK